MTKWEPLKPTFMPIDCYQDDAKSLNDRGRKFMRSCAFVDLFLIGMIKK